MAELLEACKTAWVSDIMRATLFLERAEEVRTGCRKQQLDVNLCAMPCRQTDHRITDTDILHYQFSG